ncbi:MAG: macro domain-containing protein [Nitrospinota bacterium]|nr:macro domain-containing protein [Nitrospinota bacterium]
MNAQSSYTQGPITLLQGDITALDTDAIVNPSNTSLYLGAGVSGAIRAKGGDEIQTEMDKLGGCEVGGAKATGAGKLKARYVIHAVGPRMGEGDEDAKLKNATVESMKRASELGLMSIAFPAISTGIFGYPVDRCAKVMIGAVMDLFDSGQAGGVMKVVFCLWGDEAYETFQRSLKKR